MSQYLQNYQSTRYQEMPRKDVRKHFVQTVKELYNSDLQEICKNPAYRNYFNTYFIHEWQKRITAESEKATQEFGKFSKELDHGYLMVTPSESSSYWIPDQFFQWRWGGSDDPKAGACNHGVHFNNYLARPRVRKSWRRRKQTFCSSGWIHPSRKPTYKILIN